MRAKIHWFRDGGARRPEEVASALAFVAWNTARRMLDGLRRAGFDVEAGPPYFRFLSEALARDVARILADNESELLGAERAPAIERRFIADLNRRFEEYAAFGHDADGPDFAFLRYFASLVRDLLPDKDRPWIHDQVMAIEAPQAAAMIAKGVAALLAPVAARGGGG